MIKSKRRPKSKEEPQAAPSEAVRRVAEQTSSPALNWRRSVPAASAASTGQDATRSSTAKQPEVIDEFYAIADEKG